ncbi:MAG: hypothetical protein KDJ34_11820 [Candidatus Competibacteraceae bacterium]|nr:hypothetical protein [Candidatus Competibacteraceae bacterium]MCP5135005.1 hypothetical protein [Gammaproteobacteria bacterium]
MGNHYKGLRDSGDQNTIAAGLREHLDPLGGLNDKSSPEELFYPQLRSLKMKILRILGTALVLAFSAAAVHAQGFNMQSFPDGLGKHEMMYKFLVPEGVTVTNQKGEVKKGGSIVMVPGSSIKLLESPYVKEMAKDDAFMASFMNADQYFGMPAEQVRDFAVISVMVPEGVTVEGKSGKTIKGPADLVLMVTNGGSEAMQDPHPAGYWDTMGWDMK